MTALCKDTAFSVTQQAKTAETNSFERKDELVLLARDTMDFCKGKEDPLPVYGELDGNQPDDNKINVLDLLNCYGWAEVGLRKSLETRSRTASG